jgi:hypothetical protein
MKTINVVFSDHVKIRGKIRTKMFDKDHILIEGKKASLIFLGKLLIAQANDDESCKVTFGPRESGSAHFEKGANIGFVIHRLPCEYGKINIPRKKKAKSKK